MLYLSKNTRVTLTRNLRLEVGLCNSAMGHVIDIIYAEGHYPPILTIAIIGSLTMKIT